jgi:hypothetical protein
MIIQPPALPSESSPPLCQALSPLSLPCVDLFQRSFRRAEARVELQRFFIRLPVNQFDQSVDMLTPLVRRLAENPRSRYKKTQGYGAECI